MTNLPKFYKDNCLFQLYLDNKDHSVHQGGIQCPLLDRPIDIQGNTLSKEHRKFYVLKDVPDYFTFQYNIPKGASLIKVPQYYGYLVHLREYHHIDDFLKIQLSKRNIKNLRSKKRKLERLGSIGYKVLTGPMDEAVYIKVFRDFKRLLKERFDQKKLWNRDVSHWQELYHFTYPKLIDEKAVLFAIYHNDKPICIALNYRLDHCMLSHIQTYHIDYSQYNLGDINMQFQLEWCLSNNIDILDVSKGRNPYKDKWCNHRYRLFYEIVYPKNSPLLALRAKCIQLKLSTIQRLRDIGLLGNIVNMDKWLYFIKGKKMKRTNIE